MVRLSRSSLVLFLFGIQAIVVVRTHLLRHKREWVLPPVPLTENQDYTQREFIAKIRSDQQNGKNVIYSLEGVGANQYPFHVFVVDPHNGNVRVTRKLDREEIALYKLAGFAKFPNGTEAEAKIDLQIKVIDENDNTPTFESSVLTADVYERSPEGTSVITISATDKDDSKTLHAKIAYSIIRQEPGDWFTMNKDGTIFVKNVLDREEEKTVLLTVTGQDMYGAVGGRIATATVTINIRDVNDNPPTLEKEAYEGDIEENTSGVEVMRIKAQDLDIDEENREVVFEIVKGNEDGYFSIKTDPVTNEGILFLEKPVDFEDVKDMDLGLAVRNKAPLVDGSATGANIGLGGGGGGPSGASGASGSSGASGASGPSGASGASGPSGASGASGPSGASGASGSSGASGASGSSGSKFKTYPIKINVKNQPEGPHFEPKVKPIPIKEGTPIDTNKVITSYPAIDKDTGKPAEHVKYLKGSDPQNWLSIDPKTADIKLNKMPDRESPFLVNGVYMAEILCITEGMPSKTATGTVAIQVEDLNDHCPELTSKFMTMCESNKRIVVNAKDEDGFPNGPPFTFSILPGSTSVEWKMRHFNETAVLLTTSEKIWSASTDLMLVVEDQQKFSCPKPQKLTVFLCDCTETDDCSLKEAIKRIGPKPVLGPAGIGFVFLGILALLLIPFLMMLVQCGNPTAYSDLFTKVPYDTKQHLMAYHTEGQGELMESPSINVPMQSQKPDFAYLQMIQSPDLGVAQSVSCMYQGAPSEYRDGVLGMSHWEKSGSHFESEGGQSRGGAATESFNDMSLSDSYLRGYYNKLTSADEKIVQKDHILVFDYEGTGSSADSVGCCSEFQPDFDLKFLDNLGPSFKTLAEICGGKIVQTETTQVDTPLPNPSVNNIQVSVPKLMTSPDMSLPSKVQPAKSTSEQTLISKTSKTTEQAKIRESEATVREGMTSVQKGEAQNQMVFVNQQQPVYFTAAPMLQPIQYVVQQPLQNAMILAETPGPNLQHMVMVNGTDLGSSQGVIVQGQTMMSSAQPQSLGAVLVDSNGIQGTTGNMVHAGNFSGTQNMMVVEGQVPMGAVKILNENEASLIQGGTMLKELSGCHTMLKIGESSSTGQQLQDGRGVFLQKVHDLSAGESSGSKSHTSSNTLSTTRTIHKTVVQ